MNPQRRDFLKHSTWISAGVLFNTPLRSLAGSLSTTGEVSRFINTIQIVHTNDLHNQLEPFKATHAYGFGGVRQMVNRLSKSVSGSLKLDAGDFLDKNSSEEQHREMVMLMNDMGYHAATIGNEELHYGQEYLYNLIGLMKFPLINCNYAFTHSGLQKKILPYHIRQWGKFNIGITGVGLEPGTDAGIGWVHPYEAANTVAMQLKKNMHCDLVICLSHLGLGETEDSTSSIGLAKHSRAIDLVISGHKDTLRPEILVIRNSNKEEVLVSQAGVGGFVVKEINIRFNEARQKENIAYRNLVPGLPAGRSAYELIRQIN